MLNVWRNIARRALSCSRKGVHHRTVSNGRLDGICPLGSWSGDLVQVSLALLVPSHLHPRIIVTVIMPRRPLAHQASDGVAVAIYTSSNALECLAAGSASREIEGGLEDAFAEGEEAPRAAQRWRKLVSLFPSPLQPTSLEHLESGRESDGRFRLTTGMAMLAGWVCQVW